MQQSNEEETYKKMTEKIIKLIIWTNSSLIFTCVISLVLIIVVIVQTNSQCSHMNVITIPFLLSIAFSLVYAITNITSLPKVSSFNNRADNLYVFILTLMMKVAFFIDFLTQRDQNFNTCYLTTL